MAAGTVFQLFRYHLVPFEEGHGPFVVVLIDEDVHARDGRSKSAQDVGRVLVVQHGGDAFVLQCPLYDVGLEGVFAGDESDGSHKRVGFIG